MATSEMTLKEMIEAATKPENEDHILKLLEYVENRNVDVARLRAEAEAFDQLFGLWNEEITKSDDKAGLCVRLAELNVLDTPNFRGALHLAVRKLLPPYLSSSSVVKSVGAKDAGVGVREAALRLRKLQHLRSTALVYQPENRQWGKINSIDKVTGMMAISGLHTSNVSSVPIAAAVVSAQFFDTTAEFLNLLFPGGSRHATAAQYRALFAKNSLSELSEQKIHDIISALMVPSSMSESEFEAWWTSAPAATAASAGKRSYAKARSILELDKLIKESLTKENSVLPALNAEDAASLKKMFARLRDISGKDTAMLMECVAQIAASGTDAEILKDAFSVLRGKASFWPAAVSEHMDLQDLDAWGHLTVKLMPAMVKATQLLYNEKELFIFGILMPLRSISYFFALLDADTVTENLLKLKNLSCDLILWIWKNSKTLNKRLVESIDMGRVVTAISLSDLPKEWTAAQRELKKATFDKADFQKFLIENANGDIPSIISAIQRCRAFQGGERQSVMVKFGRHSEELKAYIEAGEGRKMMGIAAQAQEEPPTTSVKSHKRLAAELEDLIKRQIPDNAAAVALARSFGDLRENAEYDAAKEKRRYLHRRRAELEKTLGFIQSTDFKNIKLDGHVVIGCVVSLSNAAGATREYTVLGAYDGDPDKNYISYKAKIGEALMHKKVGDQVTLPEAGAFTIKDVKPLPEALRKDLACE